MYKKKYKVLVTWKKIKENFHLYKTFFSEKNITIDFNLPLQSHSEKELLKFIHRYDGVICGDDNFTSKVLDAAGNLKVISKWGTGTDSIDLPYAKKKN